MDDTPNLLTVREACSRASIGLTTIYKLIGEGKLRLIKVGRASRIRSDDLTAWIDSITNEKRAA